MSELVFTACFCFLQMAKNISYLSSKYMYTVCTVHIKSACFLMTFSMRNSYCKTSNKAQGHCGEN